MTPEKVIDHVGDVWTRYPNGLYGCRYPEGTSSLKDVQASFGPLTLPDGTQYDESTPDPLSRREALALAREWAREDAGERDITGPTVLEYARFLIGDNDRG